MQQQEKSFKSAEVFDFVNESINWPNLDFKRRMHYTPILINKTKYMTERISL